MKIPSTSPSISLTISALVYQNVEFVSLLLGGDSGGSKYHGSYKTGAKSCMGAESGPAAWRTCTGLGIPATYVGPGFASGPRQVSHQSGRQVMHACCTAASGAVQGETVPYIICVEKDSDGNAVSNQKGLAERAHHPEEINAASDVLAIDAEYYLTQQVTLHFVQLPMPCQISVLVSGCCLAVCLAPLHLWPTEQLAPHSAGYLQLV